MLSFNCDCGKLQLDKSLIIQSCSLNHHEIIENSLIASSPMGGGLVERTEHELLMTVPIQRQKNGLLV